MAASPSLACKPGTEAMQGAYPELATHLEFVRRVTKVEEERFTHTLAAGQSARSASSVARPARVMSS